MGQEQEKFSDINSSFDLFITALQKQPVPEKKAIELTNKFHQALQQQTTQLIDQEHSNEAQETTISINLKMLKRERKFFGKANLQYKAWRWAKGLALSSVGILFITIGFILVVTPASPEFEIATIFYFNEFDGFTVMDMFALVLIFIGIFFFIRAFIEKEKQ